MRIALLSEPLLVDPSPEPTAIDIDQHLGAKFLRLQFDSKETVAAALTQIHSSDAEFYKADPDPTDETAIIVWLDEEPKQD